MTESIVVDEKTQLEYPPHILVVLQGLQDFTYVALKELLFGNFFDFAITILNRYHLKLFTHQRIPAF